MRAIGVRELKEHTSQVRRRVRERGEEIEVTHHGRVVVRPIPVSRSRPRPRASAGHALRRPAGVPVLLDLHQLRPAVRSQPRRCMASP